MDAFRYYDFTLAANGVQMLTVSGKNFRIQSQTGAVDVTVDSVGTLPGLLTGQGLKNVPFSRLTLRDASGAPNVGQILVAPEEFIDNRTYGVSTIAGGAVDLAAATLDALAGTRPGGSIANNAGGAAGAVLTAVAAGANLNGLWVTEAQLFSYNSATAHAISLLAKATAPNNSADGELILQCAGMAGGPGIGQINKPVFVAAGLGLHFYNVAADSGHSGLMRAARWKLL